LLADDPGSREAARSSDDLERLGRAVATHQQGLKDTALADGRQDVGDVRLRAETHVERRNAEFAEVDMTKFHDALLLFCWEEMDRSRMPSGRRSGAGPAARHALGDRREIGRKLWIVGKAEASGRCREFALVLGDAPQRNRRLGEGGEGEARPEPQIALDA